mgnify:FL=1
MNWLELLIIVAGCAAAVTTETIFRMHQGPFNQIAILTLPLAMVINYGVFHVMRNGKSLIEGIVLWSVITAIMRVASTLLILRESPGAPQWVAFCLVLLASFVSKFWR